MHTTGTQLVKAYSEGNPLERFTLIYKNYHIFLRVIEGFESGVYHRIVSEKEYNRKQSRTSIEELGVKIQTSRKHDGLEREAIEHVMIQQAIEDADFAGELLKDTDVPDEHMRNIQTIKLMRDELEVFESHLRSLPPRDYRITYRYISKEVKAAVIAREEEMADQTFRNTLVKARKLLANDTIPFFSTKR